MIGAAVGAVFGGSAAEIINSAIPGNDVVAQPQAYALVGMAATLASVCSVPLTSVLLLFELTKDYRIILPLMLFWDFSASPAVCQLQVGVGFSVELFKENSKYNDMLVTLSELEAKATLHEDIDLFINEKIIVADKVIVRHAVTKIRDG
ncbi:chloride channel F [Euphorbia peplus]|nr:chloride channel F [Euphorbia peplus]